MTTKTATHTPGPWWADAGMIFMGNGDHVWGQGHPAYGTVIEYQDANPSEDEIQANASLIAASPDLLAACELALEWMCRIRVSTSVTELYESDRRQIVDAIAKAEAG